MDVGKLQITVDLNADDLAAEITKAVEKQLEPVLAKIREQINATARDLNKIDGKRFVEVAVDAKAAQKAVDEQGRASAKAAAENEANAKALRDLAKAEAEFAAAQKSGDLVQRSMAMSKLTQAMKDYEQVTGRSASSSRDFATKEVQNLDRAAQAADRHATVSKRTANAQVANHKAIQDALNKTAKVAEDAANRRAKAEQKTRDEIAKTEKALDDAAKREAERFAASAARAASGGGGGGRGGGGGGSGGGGGTGVYGGRNFVTRFAMNPVGANVIGLGLAGIPAATLVVTDLAAALGQLADAGLAVPGIMAGIGTSVATLAVGMAGMKKATTDLYSAIKEDDPKALKKANDELKDMAPAAKDTAMAIAQLTAGPLTDLRKSVQGKMFDGLAGEVNQLGSVLIPHLTAGMGSVATAWNKTFKTLGATAMQGGNLSLLDQIFGNTAQAQTRANAAIGPLVHGLAQLSAESSSFLPRLADGVTKVSTRFDAFINKSVQNGNLDRWIDSGLTGMTHLGNAAINFGKTLEGIFKADGSRNFLEWLDKATQRWAQFTNSGKGQEQLKAFFKEAADDLHRWEPVLGNLFKLLGQIIGGAEAWSHIMLPFLQSASSLLLHMPILVQGITAAFLAWRTISGVTHILDGITKLSGALDMVPAKAKAAGAAVAEMDVVEDVAGAGGAGGVGGAGGRGRGRGRGGRMGRFARGAAGAGGFIGLDQLMQGVDPGNASNGGVGGWLQAIGGGALTGGAIGAMIPGLGETGISEAVGAAIGAAGGALVKGITDLLHNASSGDKPLVPGALTGTDYQNALSQQVMPGGPGGAPWNQQLIDQAVYGTSGSFDPRQSVFGQMTKGDANYQAILGEMSKPGGAYSSIPGLTAQTAPEMLDRIMAQAQKASSALGSLGGAITDLPTGEVVLTDPTPDIIERVKKLGGMVHSLPNGLIAIDTSQMNAAEQKADELTRKLAKIMVPGMGLSTDGKSLVPTPAAPPGPVGVPGSVFPVPGGPGFASGGIVRHFDEGGDGGGGSPWRTLAQLGSQFVDEATMVAIKGGQAMLGGAGGALGTAANVAGKVIGPLGVAAPFIMDAIAPQARTSASDVTVMNRGRALPDSSFAGMLPGYTPGQDTMSLPLYGGGKYALSGGEGVVIPEAMAALGPDWLYQINSQFRPGLPKGNYATGGILGRFAPGGVGGGKGGLGSDDSTSDILTSIRDLLGGTKYGPLTALQYSGLIQQQYLQRIATGGALNGTLAPGTTPGHLGPFGTPVKPINKMEAMMRGAIQGLGGNPDIVMGPDSVDYAISQSNAIESALKQAAGQPGGIAAMGRPSDPQAYTDALTRFAQTGQITPDMAALGLDANSPIIGALQSARMEKGPDRANIPAYIAQSLAPGGYTGQLTDENKGLLGALGTFRDQTTQRGLAQQQLNMTLAPYGGIAGLPDLIAKNPQLGALMPGGGGAGMPGAGGGAGNAGMYQDANGNWHARDPWWEGNIQAESGGQLNPPGNPNHFGLFQFSQDTWDSVAKDIAPQWVGKNPGTAPADVQAAMAQENYNRNKGNLTGQWANGYVQAHPGGTSGTIWSPGGAGAPAAPPGGLPQMPPLVPAAGPAAPGDTSTGPPTVPPGKTAYWTPQGWLIDGQVVPGGAPAAGQPSVLTGPPTGAPPPPAPPVVPPPPVPGGPPAATNAPGGGPSNPLDWMHPHAPAPPAPVPAPTKQVLVPVPDVPGKWIGEHGQIFSDPDGKNPTGEMWGVPPDGSGTARVLPPGVLSPPTGATPPVVPPAVSPFVPPGIGGPPPSMPVVPPPTVPVVPPPGAPAGTAGYGMPAYGQPYIDPNLPFAPRPAGQMPVGSLQGLQPAAANLFEVLAKQFPQLQTIGGVRADKLPYHPSGQALDVMIPGEKGLNDPTSPQGLAYGNSIWQFLQQNAKALGVDMSGSIWQQNDHHNHIHAQVIAGLQPGQFTDSGLVPPGTALAGMPGTYPGSQGQFGAGGVFGGGGGVVPVMVTNWPGGGVGGAGGVLGGPAGQQAAQIAAGVAAPVLGAAGNVVGDVAGDAINAAPSAFQKTFETPAGIAAPAVTTTGALNMHDPIQAALAAAGIDVPNMSRAGSVQLAGATFQQGGAGTGGPAFNAMGQLLSSTTGLYQRTSTDLNAHLVAMKDQLVGATTSVGDKLTKTALTPLLKAGVSAGMGAIPSAVLAAMGTDLGTAMAPPIADAVSNSGSNASTASTLGDLPFTGGAGLISGLSTTFAASGGPMTGGMAGVDSIPVMAMPGEWMLTTDEVAKMGGFGGMHKFTKGLASASGVRYMASGGAVASGAANPGTAGTNTASLGADFFGVSQIPLLGPILDVLINILLAMMNIQISVRDTMLNLTDNFRQFRGDSFKAFDAQGRLLDDTSGLIDRSMTSTSEATAERVKILTDVLEGVITYIINKVVIPLAEAVGQAAINAAASAGGGALNAIAPGAGSAAGAAASALGDASVQIAGQIGTDFWGAAVPAIGDAIATGLLQTGGGAGLNSIFGGYSWGGSAPTGVDTASLTGGLAGLLLPLVGLAGLATVFGPGSGPGALFDNGGVANGIGMMPKATIQPERVLDPTTTSNFERLVDVLRGGGAINGNSTTTVHAPITVMGNAEAGQNVRNSLLSLMT